MGNLAKIPPGTRLPVGSHQVTIIEYLSEGGFAHIYKAKIDPPENGSDIACLKRVIVSDKNGLNQLRKEVDVMKTLRHGRSIVKYYDSHAERLDNGQYQVLVLMELCPNKSLLDYMNANIKTKLAESEILKIVWDISTGVYEMHKLKLIHRDIKIENVLIDSNFDFKLCDFGSTSAPIPPPKNQHEFQLVTHDILYQTTPQYRAPEMIDLYRSFPIDEKSDIWALGCFLYKLCYYTTPFEANGDIAILHASFQFLPSPVYSGDLKNLIIIMLQENPLFRPNIVQVLIILAQLMKKDLKKYGIEDFYKFGPYNFHALHEYQKYKQNELLKQQMYYQHSMQAASPNPNSVVEQKVEEPVNLESNTSIDNAVSEKASSEFEGSGDDESHEEGFKDPDNDTGIIDESLGDLGDLDNVEERYPSLDDLSEGLIKTQSSSVSVKSNVKETEVQSSDISVNEKRKSGVIFSKKPLSDGENEVSQFSSEKALPARPSPFSKHGPFELAKEEAWKSKVSSRINEDAERLADDIFGEGSNSPMLTGTRKSSGNSTSGINSGKKIKSYSPLLSQPDVETNADRFQHDDLLDLTDSLQNTATVEDKKDLEDNELNIAALTLNDGEKEKTPITRKPVFVKEVSLNSDNINKSSDNSKGLEENHFLFDREVPKDFVTHFNHDDDTNDFNVELIQNRPLSQSDKKNRNPWEEYRNPHSSKKPREVPSWPTPQLHEFVDVPTSESESVSFGKAHGEVNSNDKPQSEFEPPSLIDLEIGLNSSSSSITPITKPHIGKKVSESDFWLLDNKDDKINLKDTTPAFKKRVPSLQSPSNFTFEEEIIDFASDDENPENNSAMSRLSIRNSLKKPKSRKPSDSKRSESQHSETHKRKSFFGANKD